MEPQEYYMRWRFGRLRDRNHGTILKIVAHILDGVVKSERLSR